FVSSQYLSVKSSRIAPADSAAASIGSTFFSTSARRSVQSAGDLSRRHLFGSTAKSGLSTRVTIGAPFASLQAATYPCDTSAAVELGYGVSASEPAKMASYFGCFSSSDLKFVFHWAQESVNATLGPPANAVFQGHAPLRYVVSDQPFSS